MSASSGVASALGCRLLRQDGTQALWDCPDSGRVVALLRRLAEGDVRLPAVRTLAAEIRRAVGADARAIAREVHAFVLRRVRWVREKIETFQSSAETLKRGFGDCDDHARLIFALLRAAGVRARIVILDRDGEPAHAVTQALLPEGWVWLETSVAAAFGEDPLQAAARLGLNSRLNMPSGLAGLAGLTYTPDGGWQGSGPVGPMLITGAMLGAALAAPLGSAVGLAAATVGPWSYTTGAAVGGAVGGVVGALGGLAMGWRLSAPAPGAPPPGGAGGAR